MKVNFHSVIIFVYIIWSFILTMGCSFHAKVTVLSKSSSEGYLKPKIYLHSDYFSQSTSITLAAVDCDTTKEFYFTENLSLVPLSSDSGWVTCDDTVGALQYQFSTSTIGTKTLYIWGKKQNGEITDTAKTIQIKYVPRLVLGQPNEYQIKGLNVGLGTPTAIKKIGNKFFVINRDISGIHVYNSMPTDSLQEPDYVIGRIFNNPSGIHTVGPKNFSIPIP